MRNLLVTIILVHMSFVGFGQGIITGSVKSVNDGPLPGVNVLVKGTTRGVTTDIDGNFTIQASPKDVLVFSFVGYITKEITVGNRNKIDVVIEEDVTSLSEVVITGFQKISRERAVGSFATMDSKKLDRIVTPNLLDKLEGQLVGVDIQDGKIVIRGQNTFNTGQLDPEELKTTANLPDARGVKLSDGSVVSYRNDPSAPLVVLDGFAFEGDINSLDANDIEQISILKDASSASVWGTKAANGVIVITRKTGRKGGLTASYSNNFKFTDRPDFEDLNYASSSLTLDMERYGLDHLGGNRYLGTNFSGAPFTAVEEIYFKRDITGEVSYPEAEYLLDELRVNSNYNEAADLFLQREFLMNHSMQVQNVGKIITNTFSANYTQNRSSNVRDELSKIGFSLRNRVNVTDWLKFDLNYTANIDKIKNNSMAGSFLNGKIRPYENFYDQNGNYAPMFGGKPSHFDEEYRPKGYFPWTYNAAQEQENKNYETTSRTDILQFSVNLDLLEGLNITSTLQYQVFNSELINHNNPNTFVARDMVNIFTTYNQVTDNVFNRTQNVPMGGGFRQEVLTKREGIDFRNQLNYNRTFGDDHAVSFILGTEYNDQQTDYRTTSIVGFNPVTGTHGTGYVNFADIATNIQLSSPYTFNGGQTRLKNFVNSNGFNNYINFGIYGIAGYGYKNKYDISTSYRVDQSNLFKNAGKNTLWSVGAGWVVSNENFFSDLKNNGNYLKVKGSFGYTGNVDRSAIPYLKGRQIYYSQTGITTLVVEEPSNPNLVMEKTRNVNVGFELGLFNKRLNITADYYDNLSKNLIVTKRTDPTYKGFSEGKVNNGALQNRGLEISINAVPIEGEFEWTVGLNLAKNKNKVVDFIADYSSAYFEELIEGKTKASGFDTNHITSYNYNGLDENGASTITINGNVTGTDIVDENDQNYYGYQVVDMDDLIYHGSKIPVTYGGLYNSFSYKNFTLGINMLYQFGHYFRLPFVDIQPEHARTSIPHKDIALAWAQSGDEQFTDIPRLTSVSSSYDPFFATTFERSNNVDWFRYAHSKVEKGDNIRISYINLNYNVPVSALGKINDLFKSVQLNAQISNMLLWTKNKHNLDPKYLYTPNPKGYTVGLKATF